MNNSAVAWAVYLGANTPARLADEWAIPGAQAYKYLCEAESHGSVKKVNRGRFEANCWASGNDSISEHRLNGGSITENEAKIYIEKSVAKDLQKVLDDTRAMRVCTVWFQGVVWHWTELHGWEDTAP